MARRIKTPGRPFVLKGYTEAQRDQLLRLIADGVTKTAACERLGIPKETVSDWQQNDTAFNERWKRAVLEQQHSFGDEILEIADGPATTMEAVQDKKVRIEARKWIMSKRAPSHHGDHIRADHTHHVGVVLLPPLNVNQRTIKAVAERLSDPEQLPQLPPE